jgi:outer membrane protein W
MKKLAFVILLCPLFSKAQKISYTASLEYRKQGVVGSGFGGGFGMNFGLTDMVSMGFSLSVVKFRELKQAYYPLLANVEIKIPSSGYIKPKLALEAGYGIYSYTNNTTSSDRYTIKGGLASSAGIIVVYHSDKKVSPYIFLGYAMSMFQSTHLTQFGSSVNKSVSNDRYGGVLARVGLNF